MKICVLGLGYVGLPTSALLAASGFQVHGVDIDSDVIKSIQTRKIHIDEPGLQPLIEKVLTDGTLSVSKEPEKSDVFVITVPTPSDQNHRPDLSLVENAVHTIIPYLNKDNLIILESTSPVGTTENIIQWIASERKDLILPSKDSKENISDIYIAYCPERVLPGSILKELRKNNRIIGGITENCSLRAKRIFERIGEGECIVTDARTAEFAKLVENSFRDVNIAFANELSIIADKLGIDIWELIELCNQHPRVDILQPGPGVGGHCIAVDPWFIVSSAPEESKLIRTAREVNDSKPYFVLEKIQEAIEATGKKITEINIACLGLAFKPNVSDLRESPAMLIAKELESMALNRLYLVEPNVKEMPNIFHIDKSVLVDLEQAINNADIILLLVDHDAFSDIDKLLLREKQVIDTRGVLKIE